jgi:hypothetical protein
LAGGTGLGAGFEGSHVVRREVQTHHPIEESGGFTGRKAQIRLAQFGQLATTPKMRKVQRRIGASGNHQTHVIWQVIEQKFKGIVNRLGGDEVVVIEDEDKAMWDSRNLVDQGRQNRFNRWRLGRLERA